MQQLNQSATDKFFITEILNDLHRNGFQRGGKAETMLMDWSNELKESQNFPASKLRQYFNKYIGKENW